MTRVQTHDYIAVEYVSHNTMGMPPVGSGLSEPSSNPKKWWFAFHLALMSLGKPWIHHLGGWLIGFYGIFNNMIRPEIKEHILYFIIWNDQINIIPWTWSMLFQI